MEGVILAAAIFHFRHSVYYERRWICCSPAAVNSVHHWPKTQYADNQPSSGWAKTQNPGCQLPNLCTAQAQGHVLIADWSLPIDIMNINEGCCTFWRSVGCVLLFNQIFRKQFTVRQYTTLIFLINLMWKLGLGLGLDSELHYFSIFTENKKNEHLIFWQCHVC